MKTISSWFTLINLAKAVGDAKKKGDVDEVRKAEKQLKEYEQVVRNSDEMALNIRR